MDISRSRMGLPSDLKRARMVDFAVLVVVLTIGMTLVQAISSPIPTTPSLSSIHFTIRGPRERLFGAVTRRHTTFSQLGALRLPL